MREAILATCHGSVDSLEDLPAFLSNIRHGHPAPKEVVDEVARRYAAVGGSPLMRISREQAAALEARLGKKADPHSRSVERIPVRVAGRLWQPTPADVLRELKDAGIERVISLPLAPQSVHVYHASVRAAAAPLGLEVVSVPSYGLEPALLDLSVEVVDEARATLPEAERAAAPVILSAHSLPKRVIDAGDPYESDFRAMAGAVAARLEARGTETRIAFQSQGMGGGAWLGPDLPTTFAELAKRGAKTVVVAAIGFVADHVETLFDLDIEAHQLAKEAGISRLVRAPAFNTRTLFIDALEAVARRALASS